MALTTHTPAGRRIILERRAHSYDVCTITMTEVGLVRVDVELRSGGDATTSDVWHSRTLSWTVASAARGHQAVDLDTLRHDLEPGGFLRGLLATVHAGHSVEWDGSNNRGRLTDAATDAAGEIDVALDSDDYRADVDVYDAADWFYRGGNTDEMLANVGLSVDSSRAEIEAVADEIAPGEYDDTHIIGGREAIVDALLTAIATRRQEIESA